MQEKVNDGVGEAVLEEFFWGTCSHRQMPVCTKIKPGSVCGMIDKEQALFHNIGWHINPCKTIGLVTVKTDLAFRLTLRI